MNTVSGNIVWSAQKGWHDGPPVEAKVQVRATRKHAQIAAQIHAAAVRAAAVRAAEAKAGQS